MQQSHHNISFSTETLFSKVDYNLTTTAFPFSKERYTVCSSLFSGTLLFHFLQLRSENHCFYFTGQAIVKAVTSGSKKFFLGTDSAPHERTRKESSCGCAGIYSAPVALSLYAKVFDEVSFVTSDSLLFIVWDFLMFIFTSLTFRRVRLTSWKLLQASMDLISMASRETRQRSH